MDGNGRDLAGIDKIALIDVSSEDDALFSSPTEGFSSHLRALENHNTYQGCSSTMPDAANPASCDLHVEQVSALDPPKPKERASEKFNMRKSLAWDSAFFTGEGVLDSEELAAVNSTFKEGEPHRLPAIKEDLSRSYESISTYNSDNLSLESLEVDLFDNLRASIQKSACASGKPAIVEYSTCKDSQRKLSYQHSSQKSEVLRKDKAKPHAVSMKSDFGKQRRKEIVVEANRALVDSSGGLHKISSPKPPLIAPRVPTVPNKRSSSAHSVPAGDSGRTIIGKPAGSSKSVTREACNVNPKSSLKTQNTGSTLPAKTLPRAPLPLPRSRATSSDQVSKASLGNVNKKIHSGSLKSGSSSTNKYRTVVAKCKDGARSGTHDQDFLKPASGISGVSPSSSVDSLASISTSSLASVSSKVNCTETNSLSEVRSSSSKKCNLSELQMLPACGSRDIMNVDSSSREALSKANLLKASSAATEPRNPTNKIGGRELKPSGLRKPTPKIGYFFQQDKSIPKNPNMCPQVGSKTVQGDLLKTEDAASVIKPNFSSMATKKCRPVSQLPAEPNVSCSDGTAGPQQSPSSTSSLSIHQLVKQYEGITLGVQNSDSKSHGKKISSHTHYEQVSSNSVQTKGIEDEVPQEGKTELYNHSLRGSYKQAEVMSNTQSSPTNHKAGRSNV